jgi:prevent-host-death family protein
MDAQPLLLEPSRVDEPQGAEGYAELLTRVAAGHSPVVVRREGEDLAAVIPLAHLELLREALARQEAERLAAQIDWDRLVQTNPPPQEWFEGEEPKPF